MASEGRRRRKRIQEENENGLAPGPGCGGRSSRKRVADVEKGCPEDSLPGAVHMPLNLCCALTQGCNGEIPVPSEPSACIEDEK